MKSKIENTLLYISQNYASSITTEQLAQRVNLSKFHFHRQFKQQVGITPQKYVEKIRLEYAAHVLKLYSTVKKVHLSFDVGYTSPVSFNRAFKNYFGVSPTEFQKKGNFQTTLLKTAAIKTSWKDSIIEIRYLPNIPLKVNLITPLYQSIENALEKKLLTNKKQEFYGIYLDAPLHQPIESCRYLLGNRTEKSTTTNHLIKAGYYAEVEVVGKIEAVINTLLKVQIQLHSYGYVFKKLRAFEVFATKNQSRPYCFASIPRKIYLPITKEQNL